jgi:hypothetical protein
MPKSIIEAMGSPSSASIAAQLGIPGKSIIFRAK